MIRRRKNKILALRDSNGNWLEDQVKLRDFVNNYYGDLFTEERNTREFETSGTSFPTMDGATNQQLGLKFARKEIDRAIFEMGPYKAPREDGLPPCFFQQNWDIVGDKVFEFCNKVWDYPNYIQQINNTLLVLIPKVNKPEFISQFRLIALCNVVYKIITKTIANRLKP